MPPRLTELPDTRPPAGLMPPDTAARLFRERPQTAPSTRGAWSPVQSCWVASNLRHQPLYFEDAMLERHGQTRFPLVQPLVSGARFFGTFPALPYAMTVDPPLLATSTLGSFRPGSGAPVLRQRPPLQIDAGLAEAGVIVGLFFLIP